MGSETAIKILAAANDGNLNDPFATNGTTVTFSGTTCTPAGSSDPTPTLTFATPTAASVDLNGTLTNIATSSIPSGGAITYASGTPGTATVSSTTGAITPVGTGTSVITATQAASSGQNAQGTQTYTLTVNPNLVANQSLPSTTLTAGTTASAFSPVTGSGGSGSYAYALYDAGNTAAVTSPFNGLSFNSSTGQITGTPTAAASATTYTVRVTDTTTNPNTVTNTFSLTVNPALTVTGINPSTGSTAGGTVTSITGTGFISGHAYSASFGGTAATSVSYTDSTHVAATSPAGTGAVSVTVTDTTTSTAATGSATFTYAADPTPTLTFATPNAASVDMNGTLINAATSSISGGGAISYASGTPVFATVNSTTGAITPVGPGQLIITATQAAKSGTNAQGIQNYTLTVNTVLVASQTAASSTLTAGTAITPFTPVTGSGGSGSYTYALYDASNTTAVTSPFNGLSFNPSTGQITGTPAAAASATTYTVRVTDTATVPTTVTNTFSVTVNAAASAPTIAAAFSPTSITTAQTSTLTLTVTNPNSGTALSGLSIAASALPANLSGTNPGTTCSGGTATFNSGSGSLSLSGATLNANASCTVTLTVSSTNSGNYSYSSGAVSASGPSALSGSSATTPTPLTVNAPAPTVTSISPTSGSAAGGTVTSITGTNFVSGHTYTVSFGGTPATSVAYTDTTHIAATSPAGTGAVSVTVTDTTTSTAATGSATFTYVAAPTVTSISPNTGPAAGGNSVVITGAGFTGTTGAASIKFGSNNATSYTVNSATQITATAPAGSGTVDVTVTNNSATSATSSSDQYSYLTTPAVASISPNAGPAAGGTAVTITGSNFVSGHSYTASFGGTSVTATYASATTLIATTPSGSGAAPVAVTDTTTSTAATGSATFTYAADTKGIAAKAIGGYVSDRANQIVANLFDMNRDIDRLNDAAAHSGNSNDGSGFAGGNSGIDFKSDLSPSARGLGGKSAPQGMLIPSAGLAAAVGPSGMQDFYGLQAMLYGAMQNAGQSGDMDRFTYAGAFNATVNTHEGFAATFHTSVSQILKWQANLDRQQAASMGISSSGAGAGSFYSPLDVWVEGTYAGYNGDRSGQFGLFTLGSDYVINPNLLLGVFTQLDSMNQTSGTALTGRGWMAGPYATVRLGDQLFWNARAAWGRSGNTLSGSGDFTSTRWLASSELSGRWKLGQGFTFTPNFGFTYFQDYTDAYLDTFGVTIPAVKTELGQLKLSPQLAYGFATGEGTWIEPSITPELIWNFASTNVDGLGALSDTASAPTGLRGRLKAGLTLKTTRGASISAFGSYDGIGATGYSAIAGQAQVVLPLN